MAKTTSYKKELWNKANTKGVIIFRRQHSEGYSYFLTSLRRNQQGTFVTYAATSETILSEKKAIAEAKKLI